jgi:hypothetical protein
MNIAKKAPSMIRIELIVKGDKRNLVIKGSSFEEVMTEYKKHKDEIVAFVGERSTTTAAEKTTEVLVTRTGTIQGRISELIDAGFFQSPRSAKEVKEELKNRAYTYSFDHVSIGLIRLVRKRQLRRLTEERNEKTIYVYTNP